MNSRRLYFIAMPPRYLCTQAHYRPLLRLIEWHAPVSYGCNVGASWRACMEDPEHGAAWVEFYQQAGGMVTRIATRVAMQWGLPSGAPEIQDLAQDVYLQLSRQ